MFSKGDLFKRSIESLRLTRIRYKSDTVDKLFQRSGPRKTEMRVPRYLRTTDISFPSVYREYTQSTDKLVRSNFIE